VNIMGRGPPIYDPVARRLLVRIREGRLECVAILADHLEEQGEPRGHDLRVLLECHVFRLRHDTPQGCWNRLRREVGTMFGRDWPWLPDAEAARLMRGDGPD
jgi:hypothetical protein